MRSIEVNVFMAQGWLWAESVFSIVWHRTWRGWLIGLVEIFRDDSGYGLVADCLCHWLRIGCVWAHQTKAEVAASNVGSSDPSSWGQAEQAGLFDAGTWKRFCRALCTSSSARPPTTRWIAWRWCCKSQLKSPCETLGLLGCRDGLVCPWRSISSKRFMWLWSTLLDQHGIGGRTQRSDMCRCVS